MILAVDPGNVRSAMVLLDDDGQPLLAWLEPNDEIRRLMKDHTTAPPDTTLVLEQVESFGMPVGREVFETVHWAGRFDEVWEGQAVRIPRRNVKLHLCGTSRAKDGNIRQALIDRFGGSREKAIGTVKAQGPLYGLKADMWAALAVGVTYYDQQRQEARTA